MEHDPEKQKRLDGLSPHLDDLQEGEVPVEHTGLHRRLGNRHIQLIAIGGSIGTALFISIGTGLAKGGPGSLLIVFILYSCVMALINNCLAEMCTAHPVSGGFIRLAGKWVDDAFGFMAGWNFFFYEALLIPLEITAVTLVISYWTPAATSQGAVAGICAACIIIYSGINLLAVSVFGEVEFWLCGGKVILIFMCFLFTFVTMVGGNPQGDAYGFRNWQDGGAFREYLSTGDKGRFEGFLASLWSAAFAVVGPEYISMVAAEAKRPSHTIKTAFKVMYLRFGIFFIGSALFIGIVCSAAEPALQAVANGTSDAGGTAGASPYVIAMQNLGVDVFPHVVNVFLLSSIFSAGNTYFYASIRILYSLAQEGRAPSIFAKTNRKGIPIYAFGVVLCFAMLSFLQCGSGSAVVLNWLTSLITGAGVINYFAITTTFLFYWAAVKAQNFDRSTLPYKGWFQPYSAWIGLVVECLIILFLGYESFRGEFSVDMFFTNYTMALLAIVLFVGWKLIKRTRFVGPLQADLIWERPAVEAYESAFTQPPASFWLEMMQLVGFKRGKGQS